jgi:hypothetical protein
VPALGNIAFTSFGRPLPSILSSPGPRSVSTALLPVKAPAVNRKIKIPGTLSASQKGPVKASPEVHERRGDRRKGPLRVERKGFAGIPSR